MLILVTDAWRAYKTYAKEKGLEHYRIKSNDGMYCDLDCEYLKCSHSTKIPFVHQKLKNHN